MEENKELNLVEILKDCPKGTKLYSTVYGEVELEKVNHCDEDLYHIYFYKGDFLKSATKNGLHLVQHDGECTLFPSKDNRDWSTFRRPFNEGDFIYTECNSGNKWISIFKFRSEAGLHLTYANFDKNGESISINHKRCLCEDKDIKYQRLASDAEIEQLINALHTKGYNWNNEAKKIEKIEEDKPKWNPDTLQPFDKVLARTHDCDEWLVDFFIYEDYGNYCGLQGNKYRCMIPYNEETGELAGTMDEAPEYYRL